VDVAVNTTHGSVLVIRCSSAFVASTQDRLGIVKYSQRYACIMRLHGKAHMPVDCVVRIDSADATSIISGRVSSRDVVASLQANLKFLFGITAAVPTEGNGNIDVGKRTIRVRVERSCVEQLRAASVLVREVNSVPIALVVTGVTRHYGSKRPRS
jgi:hypothetical protein